MSVSTFGKHAVLASLVALSLGGCVGAPGVAVDETSEAATTAFANDKPAYDYFVAKGLTNFQAAGIVGNLDQESGVDPTAVQFGGGPGRGIAQWSVGGRWDTSNPNAVSYAASKGVSVWTLNLQLDFIWDELTTVGYGFTELKATTNVTDATIVFMDKYEICGTCDSTNRVNYAKAVLAAYGATPDWSAAYVSQSWPLASQPALQVKCGESVPANIVLKNTGAKAWDSSTRLGTTQPRDRVSIFAGSDWISTSRAATSGNVAPGGNGTFKFSFHGPTGAACKPGTYHEYFGVVQEGVAWFSDNGQGGPPDNQIEALIDLVDPGNGGAGGGGTGGGGSGGSGGGGSGGGGGGSVDGGDTGSGGGDGTGGGGGNGDNTGGGTPTLPASHGGCAIGGAPAADGLALVIVLALLVARDRRRSIVR